MRGEARKPVVNVNAVRLVRGLVCQGVSLLARRVRPL
jgi:hypothetical protein